VNLGVVRAAESVEGCVDENDQQNISSSVDAVSVRWKRTGSVWRDVSAVHTGFLGSVRLGIFALDDWMGLQSDELRSFLGGGC
jgi:hypothetical protein